MAAMLLQATAAAQNAQPATEIDKRVESLLGKLTLDEKILLLGGINDFFTQSIPRVGIPSLKMSDGPMGVHDYGPTTAYPAGITLAASWDEELDEMNAIVSKQLIERMAQDPDQLRGYLNLIFVSRCLERVGDHATNIAEDAVYAAAAEDIRHQSIAATG
jgi:hypothetical protein